VEEAPGRVSAQWVDTKAPPKDCAYTYQPDETMDVPPQSIEMVCFTAH
jgi:hypothetical protein